MEARFVHREKNVPTDRVRCARIELIDGVGVAALKSLLDGLLACKPSVITDRERNEVLQKHQVIQDQVTCLLDMLLKKGEGACERFLLILEKVDPWKFGELYGKKLYFYFVMKNCYH